MLELGGGNVVEGSQVSSFNFLFCAFPLEVGFNCSFSFYFFGLPWTMGSVVGCSS